jgi:hypothetical protein
MEKGIFMNKKLLLASVLSFTALFGCSSAQADTSALSSSGEEVEETDDGPVIERVINYEVTIPIKTYNTDGEIEDKERTGIYTGKLVDGVLEGEGTFKTQNDAGVTWTYQGEFANNTFNGQGKTIYNAENTISKEGTYIDGLYSPTKEEFIFNELNQGYGGGGQFVYYQAGKDFISNHLDYFPASEEIKNSDQYKSLIDSSVDPQQLAKSVEDYTETLVELTNLYVYQVNQKTLAGYTYTVICVLDDNGNQFSVYYLDECGVLEGDTISFVGLPLDSSVNKSDEGTYINQTHIIVTELF